MVVGDKALLNKEELASDAIPGAEALLRSSASSGKVLMRLSVWLRWEICAWCKFP